MSTPLILIVEDEVSLAEVLSYNLQNEGCRTLIASTGTEGVRLARKKSPDAIILDVMLPEIDGLEVCRQLRQDSGTKELPVLMLTARSEEADELAGFLHGADDYVTKPFKFKLLFERIKALLRRSKTKDDQTGILHLHDIQLDETRHQVSLLGEVVHLTPTEFRLLAFLMHNPGRVYDRRDLMGEAIGDDAIVLERTIDVHVRSLRTKLKPRSDVIETVRGIGYRFKTP
jgi:two-component system phosphate regulon response regulator PhoB